MLRLLALLLSLSLGTALVAATRTPERFALDLAQADALNESGKPAEAARIYESILKERPKDGGLNFRYAYALYLQSITPEFAGKKGDELRKKALPHLKVARESGLENPLVADLLAHIRPDGSIEREKYSTVPEADAAMHEGEAAFSRRDLTAALAAYQRALAADPKLYRAAVFAGDSLFYAGKMDDAIRWFQRATEIDPNRETAYRYWGDALAKQGKIREALVQMSEALIAEPYGGKTWQTLRAVAEPAGRMRSLPSFQLPAAKVEWDAKEKKAQLGLDEKFTPFDLIYGLARVRWAENDFAKVFPNCPYRHSVAEEVAAFEFLLTVAKEMSTAEKPDPDHVKELEKFKSTLELLTRLRDEGLLEPFVLFLCADDGIVQDYAAYRAAHRDKLREFVRRYLVNLD
jgi:tetratricopeptide (TPR) repeat protein